MSNLVIAITGPTGSGKTTVAKILTKKLGKCVNIDADHIKHMIEYGFHKKIMSDGSTDWEYSEWELVGESIGLLVTNFQKRGFDVIINGYIGSEGWDSLSGHSNRINKFLLLPDINTIKTRDGNRAEDLIMGEKTVDEHYKQFTSDNIFKDFVIIDSSNQTAEETAQVIKEQVEK